SLLHPTPASRVVNDAYDRLRRAARGHRIRLRPIRREPIMGPLLHDFASAERLLAQSSGGDEMLGKLDRKLRKFHWEKLGELLRQAPQTKLDASTLSQ